MRWFRFYEETLNNPKAQRLPGDLFKAWVNMLCIASQNGGHVPGGEDLGFALRLPPAKAGEYAEKLISANLLDRDGDGYRPHDWDDWQYASDSSAERMRRHRKRKRDGESDETVTSHPPSPRPSPQRNSDATEQTQSRAETDIPPSADAPSGAPPENGQVEMPLGFVRPPNGDWSIALFRQGLAWLSSVTGKQPDKLRPLIGKWLKATGNDHRRVFDLLAHCERTAMADPIGWITASLGGRLPAPAPQSSWVAPGLG